MNNLPTEIENTIYTYLWDFELEAIARGGACIIENKLETYPDIHKIFLWKCSKNHMWESSRNTLLPGRWCIICER